MTDVVSRFVFLPPQQAFFESTAKIRGYGGAMGGGKTRCLCEWAFDACLLYPGIKVVLCRFAHTQIIESTKKIMIEQVLPPETIRAKKESGGEDWVKLLNGSEMHFIGLSDPQKQFSTEVGLICVDEAHQVPEESILLLNTRNRQRCTVCIKQNLRSCEHFPHQLALTFNPENPGHWLYAWFFLGVDERTRFGTRKGKLFPTNSTKSLGDAEFFFSKATDNVYLDPDYIERTLGGMPELLRQRYLEGEWLYVSGRPFFDMQALREYQLEVMAQPHVRGTAVGDPTGKSRRDRCKLAIDENGPWWVWAPPQRERRDEDGNLLPEYRYLLAADVAQGTSNDFTACHVICIDTLEQVAEFQAQIETSELAVEIARVARIYNMAEVVVEKTGGWGWAAISDLEKLGYPRIYTRRVVDRISKKWTDRLGWDTNTSSRPEALNLLEQMLRERRVVIRSSRTLNEMATFVWPERKNLQYGQSGPFDGMPQAQPGCSDDLVLALAIGLAVAHRRPRMRKKLTRKEYAAEMVTGY